MRAMGFRTAVALLPLLVLTACKGKESIDTGAVVEVRSDLSVSEMNGVRVIGSDARNKELYSYTFDLTGRQPFALPIHAGIYPRHDSSAPIQIKVVGLLNGAPVVSRSATLSFDAGRKVLLRLPLWAVCKPIVCGEAYTTCKESGTCEPDGVMSKDLPTYEAGQTASGQDAATPRQDAEVVDAPAEAGNPDGGLSPSDGRAAIPSDSRTSSFEVPSSGGSMAGSTASSDSTSSAGGSFGGNTPLGGTTSSGGNSAGGGTGTAASGGTGGNTIVGGGTSSGGKVSSGGMGGMVSSSGGTTSAAGSMSSGGVGGRSSSAGGSVSINRPAGYWKMSDWGVGTVDWHGCAWTGIDSTISGSDTTVSPADFTSETPLGGPYNISGSVYNDYGAVAMLGFNLNQNPTGAANQCAYDPMVLAGDGPPAVTMPPGGATGIAINWTATQLPPTFRIQIQGVKGSSDANNRWCAIIRDPAGPSFVPFSEFNTACWSGQGNAYKNEPIDAVTFLVPGTATAKSPYNITIIGFAPGTSKTDAPSQAPSARTNVDPNGAGQDGQEKAETRPGEVGRRAF